MALVGSISGSGGASSTVGVTGSVIFANRPNATFSSLPGSDAVFFVSGNIAPRSPGSPAASPDYAVRGTTVFGGDVVISGTLFGGSPLYIGDQIIARNGLVVTGAVQSTVGLSGSLTKLTDGTSYLIAGTNVTIVTGANGAVTISSTAAGGGGGGGFFTETADKVIYNSGSVAFTGDRTGADSTVDAASDKGTDVQFYFSGSTAAGTSGRVALFGGGLVSSGTIRVTDATNAATITALGVISGSGDLQAGGNLTVGGNSTIVGQETVGGGYGSTGVTLTSTGDVRANGFLQVDGATWLTGSVTLAGNSQTVTHTGTGNLTITSANGNVLVEGSTFSGNNATVPGNLTVNGDLYISGTTTTIDSTVVEIQDPVIGLGFASGSVAAAAGDRGFIGGITGAGNNVAFAWSNNSGSFVATKTTTAPGSSPIVVSQLQPIRASKFEVGSANAFVTSSDGNNLTAQSPAQLSLTGSTLITLGTNGGVGQEIVFNFGHNQTRGSLSWQASNTLMSLGSAGGLGLQLSSSAGNLRFRHSAANVAGFYSDASTNPYISVANSSNVGKVESTLPRVEFGNSNNGTVVLSGSTAIINHSTGRLALQEDGLQYLGFDYDAGATISSISGSAGQGVRLASGLGSTTLTLSGSTITHNAGVINFQNHGTTFAFVGTSPDASPLNGLFPNADRTYNLGSPDRRWANIYTGDLHLRNERGDYTLIEEPDALTIRYNRTGKRYRILVERAPEYDG